ncbi:PspC domain-containing protein [Sandarakinorhabdus cyanobacteriorum]|uniref:PspC domain-containing protein n=1 Tax=Sandarakinorhabdus cyanobacteriorum TaxID=1981098 RepID=A0A255YN99_9SPHN|nr:PspC domain-containing protein [Sandarakinorhabdus cyanobacteriorum]OYQ30659.1 PspC domain-containing protein [Sandarakinorhabdus cyanobacteriorum]
MSRQFLVNKTEGKVMGVCAGIANYMGWDVSLVRIAFVAAAVFGVGSPIILYLLIGLIAPSTY